MNKNRKLVIMGIVLLILFIFVTLCSAKWKKEVAVDQKLFSSYYRSIAVDSQNNPHIVYGGDHLYHAYYDSNNWYYETIDKLPYTGMLAFLAITSEDHLHICYYDFYDSNNAKLKYASNFSGSWQIETVTNVESGGTASIAVDSNKKIHISYYDFYDANNAKLLYATNLSGSWQTETIGNDGDVGFYNSLALDSNNNVHICYYDRDNGDLKYTTNASGYWQTEMIDSNSSGESNSIAIDSNDNIHISYFSVINIRQNYSSDSSGHSKNGKLKYTTNVSGYWETMCVDDNVNDPWSTSIAIDSKNYVHISYNDGVDQDLKYANNISGSWETKIIDIDGSDPSSITIDSNDNVHISYSFNKDWPHCNPLKYVTNASGYWETMSVDNNVYGPWSSSIAIDSNGNLHNVFYYLGMNAILYYATNVSGEWETKVIDCGEGKDEVNHADIAIDTNDNVHIIYYIYYDVNDIQLKYAKNVYGFWHKETINSFKSGGINDAGIAIDYKNNVHICYRDRDKAQLMYASNISGAWQKEKIDNVGLGRSSCSIANDSRGFVHISYIDEYSYIGEYSGFGVLKYTTNASIGWQVELVDGTWGIGNSTSMAIDSNDFVHIGYTVMGIIKYANNAYGYWNIETVDNIGKKGDTVSIAIDSKDFIHVSYSLIGIEWERYKNLMYATNASGSWKTETIDSDLPGLFIEPSLAIDSRDFLHIVYNDRALRDLKYATKVCPIIFVKSTSLEFGNVRVGESSILKIAIFNKGNEDLNVNSINLSNTENFNLIIKGSTNNCGSRAPIIPRDRSCAFSVIFSPSSSGLKTTILTINSNDPNNPDMTISLNGRGISERNILSPSSWQRQFSMIYHSPFLYIPPFQQISPFLQFPPFVQFPHLLHNMPFFAFPQRPYIRLFWEIPPFLWVPFFYYF